MSHRKHAHHADEAAAEGPSAAPNGQANGAAPEAPADSAGPASPTMQRAEEMVDRFAANVGSYVQKIGQGILRLAARAREEAEDIWAEAESLRRGKS